MVCFGEETEDRVRIYKECGNREVEDRYWPFSDEIYICSIGRERLVGNRVEGRHEMGKMQM